MPREIPELIMYLLNDGDGYFNDTALFTAAQKIDNLRTAYNENSSKWTEESLQIWYTESVEKDNFLGIFNEAGEIIDDPGSIVNDFMIVLKATLGDLNNTTNMEFSKAWSVFNTAHSEELNNSVSKRWRVVNDKRTYETIFRRNIVRWSADNISKLPNSAAIEILEAHSFWMSLVNFVAAQSKAKEISKTLGSEGDTIDLPQKIFLTLENEPDAAADEIIKQYTKIDEARRALGAAKFNKQKYLIENIAGLAELSRRRFGYHLTIRDQVNLQDKGQILGISQDRVLKFGGSGRNAINKITGANRGNAMFGFSNLELSKLVPKIQLSKVLYGPDMNIEKEVKIVFPTVFIGAEESPSAEKILDPYRFIGSKTGYGIKSFSWEYKGGDPFSVDRDITATLELYFQDFSEFTRERPGGYRYVDLLIPSREECPAKKTMLGERFQREIHVKAGWEVPETLSSKEKLAAVQASQVDMFLSLVDYNISFEGNGNGAATIAINYRSRLESVGKNRLINVIGATKSEIDTIKYLEDLVNKADEAKREELRKRQQEYFERVRSESSKRFIERLLDSRSVYWRHVNLSAVMVSTLGKDNAEEAHKTLSLPGAFRPLNRDGLAETLDQLFLEPSTPFEDLILAKEAYTTPDPENTPLAGDKRPEKIIYTFLGDIVQVALQTAMQSGEYAGAPAEVIKNYKIALLDFRAGDLMHNLSDVPVELGVFIEFMQNKIGTRGEPTVSFISFLKDLIGEVLLNKIDSYLNLKDGTTRSFKVGYTEMNEDLETGADGTEYDLTDPSDIRKINLEKKQQYLIVYSDSALPSEYKITNYSDQKKKDEDNGLHHFALGSAKGIIKNISFDRIDLEYARERRLTMNLEDPYALLANVFNVNISMFGNNFFRPGSYIYVDPKVMGDVGRPFTPGSIANIMGLGGYHITTGVSHKINLHSYESTLTAVFETSGAGKFSLTDSQNTETEDIDGKEKECD